MASSLDALVDDILIQVLKVLSVRSVLALRMTSRRYYLLSKFHCVWYARFCVDVLAHNIPAPGTPYLLSQLSAAELERHTLRALHLEQTWPRLSANILVSGKHNGRVDQVVFIPGGSELLTVQNDKVVHWLIVSRPGLTPSLKYIGELTPLEGVSCRILKDGEVPGVIAVGPREPRRSQRFAKVLSTSQEAPFMTLRDYPSVAGVTAGVWRYLLLLDTTTDPGGGGLEILVWRSQTSGTALLPCHPDLFGRFLDFVVFDGHILVIWEQAVSIFPVPHVPADGQVVVEPKRVFMFREPISRPVGFTTCVARHISLPCFIPNDSLDRDTDWDWDGGRKQRASSTSDTSPSLTIVARSRGQGESTSMMMLIPLVDEGSEKAIITETNLFPYRFAYLPEDVDDCALHSFTALRLGWSGRGMYVVGRKVHLTGPGLLFLSPCDMRFGPVFEIGEALYIMDRPQQQDEFGLGGSLNVESSVDEGNANGDEVDFDEGMGRFVVAKEHGGFEVVQLD